MTRRIIGFRRGGLKARTGENVPHSLCGTKCHRPAEVEPVGLVVLEGE